MITAVIAGTMIWAQAVAATPAESVEIEVTRAESRVGYEALLAGDFERAIAEIEANTALAEDDPARLINLGVAHASAGDEMQARELFRAAIASSDQMELETSEGKWVYSRALARRAIKQLASGDLYMARMAAR